MEAQRVSVTTVSHGQKFLKLTDSIQLRAMDLSGMEPQLLRGDQTMEVMTGLRKFHPRPLNHELKL